MNRSHHNALNSVVLYLYCTRISSACALPCSQSQAVRSATQPNITVPGAAQADDQRHAAAGTEHQERLTASARHSLSQTAPQADCSHTTHAACSGILTLRCGSGKARRVKRCDVTNYSP
ncbi:hypothetical protein COO60DRAFT_40614 [Scenedesmus sp. NREL 46B-D3]|nr:hypothetical protein COO60DRAFT_40614 [Scenedesmus sp. NREL 46B-D3]